MKKGTKIWLIVAASLVLAGAMIFVGVMTVFGWDFTKLSTVQYETKEYAITEDYQNLSIVSNTADIVLVPAEGDESRVVCREQKNLWYAVSVKDGTLVIEIEDHRKWYEHIGINFGTSKVTVYLPVDAYGALAVRSSTGDVEIPKDFSFESVNILQSTGDVVCHASALNTMKITTSTGDIRVENLSVGTLDLSVSTGDITASGVRCAGDVLVRTSTGKAVFRDVSCNSLTTVGDTGDLHLKNVIAVGGFSIKTDTGDVRFEACDAAEILIKTDTGDVKGSLLSEKVFVVQTDTGSIDVPQTVSGGRCEITTDTGDIKISLHE